MAGKRKILIAALIGGGKGAVVWVIGGPQKVNLHSEHL